MNHPTRANVLIVDDQPANLLALETVLKSPDLNIIKVKSGNEALAQLLEHEFACIILDVRMPEMDGFELARIIRSDERTKLIPLIFASGEKAQSDIFKGYESGAVDYLMKPIDPTVVKSKVNVFAELYRKEVARRTAEKALAEYAEELRRSNADLDQFASVAAHDLQAPLRRIASGANLLKAQFEGKVDTESLRWLTMMTDNAKRMQQLIEDLLTYAKAGREKLSIPVQLDRLVTEVLGDLAVPIEESGAKIHYRGLPVVQGHPLGLRQLMQNLISNAIKYRRKGVAPEVTLTAEKHARHWQFRIQDNGIGIDSAHLGKLFMIFARLHNQDEYPGTGIGLAICKKIVERHGGTIWIDSAPGKGSTFLFTLPETLPDDQASA